MHTHMQKQGEGQLGTNEEQVNKTENRELIYSKCSEK